MMNSRCLIYGEGKYPACFSPPKTCLSWDTDNSSYDPRLHNCKFVFVLLRISHKNAATHTIFSFSFSLWVGGGNQNNKWSLVGEEDWSPPGIRDKQPELPAHQSSLPVFSGSNLWAFIVAFVPQCNHSRWKLIIWCILPKTAEKRLHLESLWFSEICWPDGTTVSGSSYCSSFFYLQILYPLSSPCMTVTLWDGKVAYVDIKILKVKRFHYRLYQSQALVIEFLQASWLF